MIQTRMQSLLSSRRTRSRSTVHGTFFHYPQCQQPEMEILAKLICRWRQHIFVPIGRNAFYESSDCETEIHIPAFIVGYEIYNKSLVFVGWNGAVLLASFNQFTYGNDFHINDLLFFLRAL